MTLPSSLRWMAIVAIMASSLIATGASAERSTPSAQAMVNAAQQAFNQTRVRLATGSSTIEEVYRWSVRWYQAQRRHQPSSAPAASRSHLRRMQDACREVGHQVSSGTVDASANHACAYYLAEARVWVQSGP